MESQDKVMEFNFDKAVGTLVLDKNCKCKLYNETESSGSSTLPCATDVNKARQTIANTAVCLLKKHSIQLNN